MSCHIIVIRVVTLSELSLKLFTKINKQIMIVYSMKRTDDSVKRSVKLDRTLTCNIQQPFQLRILETVNYAVQWIYVSR